ncbi:hypothetical protein J6590_071771 [Homalodisca vitripennis]|nr:hypothetical protein J6590_071771 [Homalodisca vitripennis]
MDSGSHEKPTITAGDLTKHRLAREHGNLMVTKWNEGKRAGRVPSHEIHQRSLSLTAVSQSYFQNLLRSFKRTEYHVEAKHARDSALISLSSCNAATRRSMLHIIPCLTQPVHSDSRPLEKSSCFISLTVVTNNETTVIVVAANITINKRCHVIISSLNTLASRTPIENMFVVFIKMDAEKPISSSRCRRCLESFLVGSEGRLGRGRRSLSVTITLDTPPGRKLRSGSPA